MEKGYVNGYEDGTFRPDRFITRAEFAKLVVTALELPVTGSVVGSEWYLPYVNAAVGYGVHNWSDLNTGTWNTAMTRLEMSRMAVRATGEKNEDTKKWMYLATRAGLIKGMDDRGSLAVDGTTTRAQAVTIIERILTVKAGEKLPADKRAVSRAEVLWHKTNLETMLDGIYIDVAATHERDKFKADVLYSESRDGNYKGWIEGYYVIDLDDPKDPFRYLLDGDVEYMDTARNLYKTAPKSGYAIISVTKFEMKENTANLSLMRLPEITLLSEFITSESHFMVNGDLKQTGWINYMTPSGMTEKIVSSQAKNKGTNYITTFRTGIVLPKGSNKARSTASEFALFYHQLSDFGQPVPRVANYSLTPDRR